MKLLIISFVLAFSVFSQNTLANETKVAPVVLKSFEQQFASAKEVDWTVSSNFYKAHFVMNDQHITAFYDNDGTLLALTRNITSVQLPVTLQAELKKNYEQFWISELFEMNTESGTEYYVTLENADVKVVLKSTSHSTWSNFQKTKK